MAVCVTAAICPSFCHLSRFLAPSGENDAGYLHHIFRFHSAPRRMRAFAMQLQFLKNCLCNFSGCTMLLERAAGYLKKEISCACRLDAATQNQQTLSKGRQLDTIGGYVLFVVAAVRGAQSARGIQSISGELHQEDLYYRTARAIDVKIGVSMVDMIWPSLVCNH